MNNTNEKLEAATEALKAAFALAEDARVAAVAAAHAESLARKAVTAARVAFVAARHDASLSAT